MTGAALGRRGRRALGILGPALCGILAAVALSATGWLDGSEQDTIDTRFEIRGPAALDDLVLIELDETSRRELRPAGGGAERSMHTELLNELRKAQPKVVAYDFDFSDPQRGDDALIAAMARAEPFVLGATVRRDGATIVFGDEAAVAVPGIRVAAASYEEGPGGVIDRVAATHDGIVPTLAREVAEQATPPDQPLPNLDDFDGALIDYAGPADTVRRYTFLQVMHDQVPHEALRDKIVVVGGALQNNDLHRTPFGDEPMTGAEINANAISTVMRGFPLRDASPLLDALLLVVLCLGGAAAGRRWGSSIAVAAGAGCLLALAAVAQLAFDRGTVIATVSPAIGLGVSVLTAILAEHRTVGRERARLAEIVSRLAPGDDPERVLARVAGTGAGAVLVEGSRFGEYRISEPLGVGAMGVVYRAHHEALDRPAAIKVLAPALAADERIRERLRREARNAARLEHPNVVAVLDAGAHGGREYIAMALVEGRPLHDLVGTPQLTTRRIAEIVADVAAGLDHAHERGVVHRDVKPQNILVEDATGRALLADFGIAAAAGQDRLTQLGDVVGTVAYAAPEQLSGAEPDRLVDVYALGCVLYELLTGRLPFEHATLAATIQAHLAATPPPVSEHRPDLRATGFDEVVARALAKSPAERWQSAGALARAASAAAASAPAGPPAAKRLASAPGDRTKPA